MIILEVSGVLMLFKSLLINYIIYHTASMAQWIRYKHVGHKIGGSSLTKNVIVVVVDLFIWSMFKSHMSISSSFTNDSVFLGCVVFYEIINC